MRGFGWDGARLAERAGARQGEGQPCSARRVAQCVAVPRR